MYSEKDFVQKIVVNNEGYYILEVEANPWLFLDATVNLNEVHKSLKAIIRTK